MRDMNSSLSHLSTASVSRRTDRLVAGQRRSQLGVFCMIVLAIAAAMSGRPAEAAPFRNLDFERTDGVESGIPEWEIPEGIPYLYNSIFAGEGAVTLYDASFPFFDVVSGFGIRAPLEGAQSVLMSTDDYSGSFMSQVGDVPPDAVWMLMLASSSAPDLNVRMDGVPIPLTAVGPAADAYLVAGNVSAFAGRTVTLSIAGTGPPTAFDAIRFEVPEPSTVVAAVFCMGLLALPRRGFDRTTVVASRRR